MLLHWQLWPYKIELWTHTHLELSFFDGCLNIIPPDPSIAIIWLIHTSNHWDQCCLSCAVWSQKSKCFVCSNCKIETPDCRIKSFYSLLFIQLAHIVDNKWVLIHYSSLIFIIWETNNFLPFLFWEIIFLMLTNIFSKLWIFRGVNLNSPLFFEHLCKIIKWEQWTSSYTKLLWNDLKQIDSKQKEHHKA